MEWAEVERRVRAGEDAVVEFKRGVGDMQHPGYRERLLQLLAFDGRVLFQSYTTDPFSVRDRHYL